MLRNVSVHKSSLVAMLMCCFIYFSCASAVTGQTPSPSPGPREPFGSSLKRPKQAERPSESQKTTDAATAGLPQPDETITIDTLLVVQDVIVTDATGTRLITGLGRDDFVVVEDGAAQQVAMLTLGDDPGMARSVILILDRSDSELPYIEASVEAAKRLVEQLTPRDRMAIVTDNVELAIDFTSDKKILKKTLDALKNLTLKGYKSKSFQFSALLATLRELIDKDPHQRPVIIFQTDGDQAGILDPDAARSSRGGRNFRLVSTSETFNYTLADIYAEVEKSQVKIYTVIPNDRVIGIPQDQLTARLQMILEKRRRVIEKKDMWYGLQRVQPESKERNAGLPPGIMAQLYEQAGRSLVRGQEAASRVAELSGGTTSFIETPGQAGAIYERILANINHRYIIGYYPTNKLRDGKRREVRIEVRGHPEYIVHGRKSYYATSP